MSKILINETHLCILEREFNNQTIKVSFKELQFPYQSSFLEMKGMAENDNRNYQDIEKNLDNSPLKVLLGQFDFCSHLDGTYQGIKPFSKIDNISYLKNLEEYDKSKLNICFKIEFIKEIRIKVYDNLCKRRIAYMLSSSYEQCKKSPDILAFSHRRVGWTNPEFQLGSDFVINFKTNFGYGMASYFYLNIRYKGIDIIPYSDWIRYRICSKYDIIQYTRAYPLENYSWDYAMQFAAEIFNYSITDPENFVEKWIINECEEMVNGLEYLINHTTSYKVIYSLFKKVRFDYEKKAIPQETITGREFFDFKGAKISGALSFLAKISTLKTISYDVEVFISRIMNCNMLIYKQLKNEIQTIDGNIFRLKLKIRSLQHNEDIYDRIYKMHSIRRNEIELFLRQYYPIESFPYLYDKTSQVVSELYPELEKKLKKYEPFHTEYIQSTFKLNSEESWEKKFQAHVDVIELHFNEVGAVLTA